jgi:hypothetical protein
MTIPVLQFCEHVTNIPTFRQPLNYTAILPACHEHAYILTISISALGQLCAWAESLHCIMHWIGCLSIGVANKRHYLSRSWIVSLNLKHILEFFTDLLCLRVARVPRSQEVAIFVLTTQPITLPLAHVCGVITVFPQCLAAVRLYF